MGDKKITRESLFGDVLREHIAISDRLELLRHRREEIEEIIRFRVTRAIWRGKVPAKRDIEDAEEGIRENFPGLPAVLGLHSYKEAAAWLIAE